MNPARRAARAATLRADEARVMRTIVRAVDYRERAPGGSSAGNGTTPARRRYTEGGSAMEPIIFLYGLWACVALFTILLGALFFRQGG